MNILLKVWEILKSFSTWAWNHKNKFSYIVLVVLIMYLSWQNSRKKIAIDELNSKNTKLSDTLESSLTVGNSKVKIVYRDKDGEIKVKEKYLPSEGNVEVKHYKDANISEHKNLLEKLLPKLNETIKVKDIEYIIHDKGFCLVPGYGIIYDGKYNDSLLNVGVDLKFIYFQWYSLNIGSSLDYPYLGFSRHLDDLIPVIHPKNIEGQIIYGKPYKDFGKNIFGFGLRSNF